MDALEVAERYFRAHNSRDLDSVGALLTEDAEFELAGVWTIRGREQVLRLAQWDAALNTRLEPAELQAEGGTVSCRLTERNDWFRAVGIEEIRYERGELHMVGGRVARIRAVMDPEGFGAIAEVLGRITKWAKQACSDELSALMPAGQFQYNGPNARRWLMLLARWCEARESYDDRGGKG
jgi:hypothetical protein